MVSSRKLIKMLQSDKEQLEKIIDKLTVEDLKQLVKMMLELINEQRKDSAV